MNTKQTKVEVTGTIHEVVMGYYDESIPFENIEYDKVVEGLEKSHFYQKILVNPEQTSIFAENENYIIASAKINDLDGNVSRLEALNESLSTQQEKILKLHYTAISPVFQTIQNLDLLNALLQNIQM
jgi:hypothetical protein